MKKVFLAVYESIKKNLLWVAFFSVPFLFAFLIPILSPLPAFTAIGGFFLRFGSIPLDITLKDMGIIIICTLASIFIYAFSVVNLNILIKSQRTQTNIRTEVIDGIEKYTINIFWMYLTILLLSLVVSFFFGQFGSILLILLQLPIFFAPAAMVIEDYHPFTAMKLSLQTIRERWEYVIVWILIGQIALTLFGMIFPNQVALIVFNSLIVLPFLTILNTHIYLSKYTIIN